MPHPIDQVTKSVLFNLWKTHSPTGPYTPPLKSWQTPNMTKRTSGITTHLQGCNSQFQGYKTLPTYKAHKLQGCWCCDLLCLHFRWPTSPVPNTSRPNRRRQPRYHPWHHLTCLNSQYLIVPNPEPWQCSHPKLTIVSIPATSYSYDAHQPRRFWKPCRFWTRNWKNFLSTGNSDDTLD